MAKAKGGFGGVNAQMGAYNSGFTGGAQKGGPDALLGKISSIFGKKGGGSANTGGIMGGLRGHGDFKNIGGGGGQGSTGGSAGGGFSGPGITNTAQKDARIEQSQQMLDDRYKQLSSREGQMDPYLQESINKLRERESADTTGRAIDRAGSAAGDWAAGMKERMAATGAQRGQGQGYGGQAAEGAAQRLQAKSAADISLGRERDLDQLAIAGHQIRSAPSQLDLARTGQTNQVLGQIGGNADMGARIGLEQGRLGLDQWKAGEDSEYKKALLEQQGQQGQIDLYLKLLGAAGY